MSGSRRLSFRILVICVSALSAISCSDSRGNLRVTETAITPVGAPVEITAGTFQGLRGTVVRRGGQTRLVVEVEFLRRGVSVEVEEWALRPVAPTADRRR